MCVCADSVHARGSADSHVNAAGPQRSVELAGPRPLCHTVHGHCLGKTNTTILHGVYETLSDRNMLVTSLLMKRQAQWAEIDSKTFAAEVC